MLLIFQGSIQFNGVTISPGCYPKNSKKENYNYKISNLHAVGFGSTTRFYINPKTGKPSQINLSNKLKEVFFNDNSHDPRCSHLDHLICVKELKPGESVCYADNGSPLMINQHGRIKIIGIYSFEWSKHDKEGEVYYCASENAYSRLSFYNDLFRKQFKDDYCTI